MVDRVKTGLAEAFRSCSVGAAAAGGAVSGGVGLLSVNVGVARGGRQGRGVPAGGCMQSQASERPLCQEWGNPMGAALLQPPTPIWGSANCKGSAMHGQAAAKEPAYRPYTCITG